jgi:DNA polymerase I-like protein with 3'-5' exonuclease and polymerase domains
MGPAERAKVRSRLVGTKKEAGEWEQNLPAARDFLLKKDPVLVRTTAGMHHMLATLAGEKAVGFDLETTGLCPHRNYAVIGGFATEGGDSWLVDFKAFVPELRDWQPGDPTINPMVRKQCPDALLPLKDFLESPERPVLVGTNLQFDLQFCAALGLFPRERIFCTQLAHRILNAGQEEDPALFSSLQWCAGHLLGLWVAKDEQHELNRTWADKLEDKEALRYAATDCLVSLGLRNGMKRPDGSIFPGQLALILRDKPKTGLGIKNIAAIEFGCVHATAELSYIGMHLAPDDLATSLATRQQETKALHTQLLNEASALLLEKTGQRIQRDLLGRPSLSFSSSQQVGDFFRRVGIEIPGDSIDQQVLKLLANPPELIFTYLRWKELETMCKQLITYRDAINPATGRLHAYFDQFGADSGRFTSRNPNAQNPSKKAGIRDAVKPQTGNAFVDCDYTSVEMLIMAALSGDETMIQAIKDKVDLHKLTGSAVAGKSIEEVTKDERQASKAVNFSLIYAAGAETLKDYAKTAFSVEMTLEEAEKARDAFFNLYTGIQSFHKQIKRNLWELKRAFEADPTGDPPTYETRTLGGRKRTLVLGSMTAQTASNSPTQGSGADCLKLAMGRMRKELDAAGLGDWFLVNSIHDELLAEGPKATASKAKEVVERVMVDAANQIVVAVPITADAKVAATWAEK